MSKRIGSIRFVLSVIVMATTIPVFFGGSAVQDQPDQPPLPQPKPPPLPEVKKRQPTVNEALLAAFLDMGTLDPDTRYFTRYIWIRSGDFNRFRAVSLALQYISTSTNVYRPFAVGKDNLLLARIDLRAYSRDERRDNFVTLQSNLDIWEEFRFEPALNVLLTKDTLAFNFGVTVAKTKKPIQKEVWESVPYPQGFVHTDGKTYYSYKAKKIVTEYVEVDPLQNGDDVVRQISPHVDLKLMEALIEGTHSQAPLVTDGYFLSRALRQVQDTGVYRTIFGGLYYRFKAIPQGKGKGKVTDEDVLFDQLGVAPLKAGVTAEQVFDRLRSDSRVFINRSKITNRERSVSVFRQLIGHSALNSGNIYITHDPSREQIDIGNDPAMNLRKFVDAGREYIFEDANGFSTFVAGNGDGKFLDQVGDTIIPGYPSMPFTGAVEEAAWTCIGCHGPEHGFRRIDNEIKLLVGGNFDVFADFNRRNSFFHRHRFSHNQQDDIARLVGLYQGDLEQKTVPRARNDLANAFLIALSDQAWPDTKGFEFRDREKGLQALRDVVPTGSALVALGVSDYYYRHVNAVDALRDLGMDKVPEDVKVAGVLLGNLLAPLAGPVASGYPVTEDPRIILLVNGGVLQRPQYDLVQSFIASRVALKQVAEKKGAQ